MQINYYFFCLFINIFLISATAYTQTVNFDETWKEFLDNNKISNMSELIKPDKVHDQADYVKYLLMNTNSKFCQSKVENAEELMAEVKEIDPQLHKSIPRFVMKMDDLETKIKAYHSIDEIWKQFLKNQVVNLDDLEAVKAAKTVCEKKTLAKYSYMTAYHYFCLGDISKAKNIFENRTLKLAEKTSLRIKDVEGLAEEVAKMKSLFQDMSKLETSWRAYVKTGVSSGFNIELPLFPCYPIPNMKEAILKGAVDICNLAPIMLEKVKKLQADSGVAPDTELKGKIKDLEAAVEQYDNNLAGLNKAWEAFIPNNSVIYTDDYGYEYCGKEPLIRAYIMDGFAFVCETAEESLEKIYALQNSDRTPLEKITMIKIKELEELNEQYQSSGGEIEAIWSKFVAQGDTLSEGHQSTEIYCDNIHQVKDWVISGHCAPCDQKQQYIDEIESFQSTFEFNFTEELECRIQKLRIKLWDCRYPILQKIARLEATDDSYEERLAELMEEYRMGERPEVCLQN